MSHSSEEVRADERVRVAFSMLRRDYEDLKREAAADGRTLTYYIRQALSTYRWVKEQEAAGRSIWVSGDKAGTIKEVVFR